MIIRNVQTTRARSAAVAIAVVAMTAGLLVGAAPAWAAELPEDDGLYVVATGQELFGLWQLLAVSPTWAGTAEVGRSDTPADGQSQVQGAVDPATGLAYFVGYDPYAELATIDLNTGEWTEVGPIEDAGGSSPAVVALAIGTGGDAYLLTESSWLYRIDLATAEASYVGVVGPDIHAFAYDTVTNAYYGLDLLTGDLYSVDVSDGAPSFLATVEFTEPGYVHPVALQFDSAGALWVLAIDAAGSGDALYSFTFDGTDAVLSGLLSYDGAPFTSHSLLIGTSNSPPPPPAPPGPPTPVLPATGTGGTAALAASALLVLLGLAFVARRRRAGT